MPALDRYHDAVIHALEKDGWTITHNPLTLKLDARTFYVDLGAERLIGAEKNAVKIAVEIKTFRSASPIADLEQALVQFGLYEEVLQEVEPDRLLYLAVPGDALSTIFAERIRQRILTNRIRRAFSFSPETEAIEKWIP